MNSVSNKFVKRKLHISSAERPSNPVFRPEMLILKKKLDILTSGVVLCAHIKIRKT